MSAKNLTIAVLVALPMAAADAPKAWTPELSMKVQGVGEVTPSADGKWVVWTQTHALMEGEKSENRTQVFLARSDGSDRLQLTWGEKSASSPRFSSDARFVFFSSERDGKAAIYRIATDGGEAERITDFKGSIASFELSPDGKWIAFTGRETDSEEERAKREKRDFRVIDESPKNAGLWLTPVDADVHGKREIKRLEVGAYHVSGIQWSPDSRRIAFEARPAPDADLAREADIFEVEVETGRVHTVANTRATESQPRYSHDGRYLAFVRSSDPPSTIGGAHIVIYTRENSKDRELPATPDESPNLIGWAADSRSLLFAESKGTKVVIYSMPVDGPPKVFYSPHAGTVSGGARINSAGTHLAFARQSPAEPVEAYVLALSRDEPVRVSAANVGLAKPPLGETRVVRWKSKDGKEVEGLLTLPVDYQQGKKVPLILNIHGGPSGAFSENFIGAAGAYPIAVFAAKGYAVLRPNPRGSVAYGLAFRAANLNDWGGGDYNDLMSGVDAMIAQGIADPDKLAVMGWSYGGYMTNWIITQTGRFKAASAGAGLSDMPSMWGTNDIPTVLDDYFSGAWYDQPERYIKLSPIDHVQNVTTPTLFLHGEQDERVPTAQGYEMYNALKRKGVETKMVVYPRQHHGPSEPKFVLDIMQRNLDWVEKHLGG